MGTSESRVKPCSQCSFTTQFESALSMHRQLHHDTPDTKVQEKSNTVPRMHITQSASSSKENKGAKLGGRTSSATRLFDKLRARISRRNLPAHPEEGADTTNNFNDISGQSECTSKAMKEFETSVSGFGVIEPVREQREIFSCHLCSFDSDRITVLDRHLLNDHKIGLDNLLKLVLSKTKDGLSEDGPAQIYGIRQPYYRLTNEIIEDGEFVIETVTPKIKILKHTSTNTDIKMADIPNLTNCQNISKEIEKLLDLPLESSGKNLLMQKIQNLNECMCKFVDSTNTIKKVLTKEFDQKTSGNRSNDAPYFNLGLGDQESPKQWERAHSENLDRSRSKYRENRQARYSVPWPWSPKSVVEQKR
ncbi:uncharacterized protein LOC112045953 [Bicyclus anynana]|uniref:Uncharacterized protein LOC112045953 n=1 Tax=Bicyclus anynana TaxID=110368 RepID=A0ABM3LV90_BICAN|nr:uncharacterized protein LOC112045953 [Bicyclus anynana]